jgi:4-alpha-glucanotransferase
VGRISVALVLHNHQPVGNFGWVIAEAYERSYEPLVAALERHPGIRLALHYTGPLLDWLAAERPAFLERVASLVAAGRVELLGGGYYEPVLASLPEKDRLAQLRLMGDAIERIGGRRPTGAWLAERVWEPDVPVALVDGGYRWTILDDAHFRAASIDESDLWGSYTTEDQGRLLTVFGSDKNLRYRIPFGAVEDVIAYLAAHASPDRHLLAVMGDDGEKFGAWPGTFEHCWGEDGWVDRFFTALAANADRIDLVTPGEWTEREPPLGRIYLPTSSYFEMGEWALPADEGLAFERAVAAAQADGRAEARWLRGGFWRNFQVKYREINDLHKQMLRASSKVARMAPGPACEAALLELMQGQSNDCYWHGVFGGIYIAHMRLATYEHLIAAEDAADAAARGAGEEVDGIALADTDLDGLDEVLVTSPGQTVVIDSVEGGGIGSWDIRPVRHALAAVMRRRPEAYHQRLIDSAAPPPVAQAPSPAEGDHEGASGVASIHAVVRSREPGLADRLQYDAYERRSGLVHLFAPGTTRESYARAEAVELGDAHTGGYDVIERTATEVGLARDVRVGAAGVVVRVEKRFTFDGSRRTPAIGLEVAVENRSTGPVRFDLGLEWATMLLGGGGNPAAYYEIDGKRQAHDSAGEAANLDRIRSGNTYIGLQIETSFAPATTVWWAPIETVSNSEYGFERIYQGSALVGIWPVELVAGDRRSVRVGQRVSTDRDRAED